MINNFSENILTIKNKLNNTTTIDNFLEKLSQRTIRYILKDLENINLDDQDQTQVQVQDNPQDKVEYQSQVDEPLFKPEQDNLYIFTDGNCKKNGKVDSIGAYGIYFTNDTSSDYYKFNTYNSIEKSTNNICELTAILELCKIIENNQNLFTKKNIIVCTDSMYSINCITKWASKWEKNNWKTANGSDVKNEELIKSIIKLYKYFGDNNIKISFKHVFSHLKEPSNKNSLDYLLWYGNNEVDKKINQLLN